MFCRLRLFHKRVSGRCWNTGWPDIHLELNILSSQISTVHLHIWSHGDGRSWLWDLCFRKSWKCREIWMLPWCFELFYMWPLTCVISVQTINNSELHLKFMYSSIFKSSWTAENYITEFIKTWHNDIADRPLTRLWWSNRDFVPSNI